MMNRFLSLSLLISLCAASLLAQSPYGTEVRSHGNSVAGVTRTATATGTLTSSTASARSQLDLVGSFLRRELTIASVKMTANNTGTQNQIVLKVAGITVLRANGGHPILHLTVWRGQWTILDVGVFDIRAEASAGGGAQFGTTLTGRISPPEASINGAAQVYGNAEGGVSLNILYGLAGRAKASLIVNFLNSTLRASLPITRAGIGSVNAHIDTILWELLVKAKVEVFGITVASDTFVSLRGPSMTRRIL